MLDRETTWVWTLLALSGCSSAPAGHDPERVDAVTPKSPIDKAGAASPTEREANPEAVEGRWHLEEARARKLADQHAAEHRRARVDVLGVRGSCAGIDRRDYTTCPLDLFRAGAVLQDTPDGVIVRCPAGGVDVERLRRLARCQATMSLEAQGACPLWQPGARVVVRAEGDHVAIEITSQTPGKADEIRRRVGALFSAAVRR